MDQAGPEANSNAQLTLNIDKTLNERVTDLKQDVKINQEELFSKIKGELFVSLTENFSKLENELSQLKSKQNFEQIQKMLQNFETKSEVEQRKIELEL